MYVIRSINELLSDLGDQLSRATSQRVRLEAIQASGEKYYTGKTGLKIELAAVIGKQQSYQNAIEMALAFKRTLDLEEARRVFWDFVDEIRNNYHTVFTADEAPHLQRGDHSLALVRYGSQRLNDHPLGDELIEVFKDIHADLSRVLKRSTVGAINGLSEDFASRIILLGQGAYHMTILDATPARIAGYLASEAALEGFEEVFLAPDNTTNTKGV